MTIVLDASYALNWVGGKAGAATSRALPGLVSEGFAAPAFFWHEVASGLRSMAFRNDITSGFRFAALMRLRELEPELDGGTSIESVVGVSDRFQLSIYDAAYLELALRRASRLATHDGGLSAAARKAGVDIVPA